MRKESGDKEREEKLFNAIGDLPEEMIAQAARYKRPKSRSVLHVLERGLAVAVCAALVILGVKGGSFIKNHLRDNTSVQVKQQSVTENAGSAVQGEESSEQTESTDENKIKKGNAESEKDEKGNYKKGVEYTPEIQVWTAGMIASGDGVGLADSSANAKKEGGEVEDTDRFKASDTLMEEGKTILLETVQAEESGGEEISVITVRFDETEQDLTYLLHSQASNCKIVSVTHEGVTKLLNLPDAECAGGDVVELDTRQYALASWAYDIVPEWEEIDVIDIVDITGKEESGEEFGLGRIVIGKQSAGQPAKGEGEQFYGIYQKKND